MRLANPAGSIFLRSMSDDADPMAGNPAGRKYPARTKKSARLQAPGRRETVRCWLDHFLSVVQRLGLVSAVVLAGVSACGAETTTQRILLPIEVLGQDGTIVSTTTNLQAKQALSVRALWLKINGLRYASQGSVQVNTSAWIPLNNNTVTIAEPGRSFGGIGGGFATLGMTLLLPGGTAVAGTNTIRFRFNQTEGLADGFRVLAWNFLKTEGEKVLLPDEFAEDLPESWKPLLPDKASIQAGRELWQSAPLRASSLPSSTRIRAHCADCHTRDGRDLKYFNFSNTSIVARSCFHGLSNLEGQQIASYIRSSSLPFPHPGRPWNPPYQPGPGLDAQPVSNWAAGAGLAWVLDHDTDALPYLLRARIALNRSPQAIHATMRQASGGRPPGSVPEALSLLPTPEMC